MATIKQVLEGLKIIQKYEGDEADIAAEHDIIYAGDAAEISEEDQAKMKELGWHVEDTTGCYARFV